MNMLRLTKEQDDKLNKLLITKFGPKFLVTGEVAGLIKARLTQTLEKSGGALTKEDIQKAFTGLDAVRDSMTKTGGLKLPKVNGDDLTKEFDEEKHPRDASGRFGAGGGGGGEGGYTPTQRAAAAGGRGQHRAAARRQIEREDTEAEREVGAEAAAQQEPKWGYYGTATARDEKHDEQVETALEHLSPEEKDEFLGSSYGRYMADAIHGMNPGHADVARQVTRHLTAYKQRVKEYERRYGKM